MVGVSKGGPSAFRADFPIPPFYSAGNKPSLFMIADFPVTILQQCQRTLDAEVTSIQALSGGDVNQAKRLETSKGTFFVKVNSSNGAARMFETEAKGLDALHRTGVFRTPGVVAAGSTQEGAYLLLEYIESGPRTTGFWTRFGSLLADLHQHTDSFFGLDHDNFIGSLPQYNGHRATWAEFYQKERLKPQLELAISRGLLQPEDAKAFDAFFVRLPNLFPVEPPALVHGDLWSGNFMVSPLGQPVLIDPAISFSHREVDLAMARLFGGFDRQFFQAYEEVWPLEPGFEERLPAYQLYYLMVHLNLFGGSYVDAVRGVIKQFA